MASLEFECVGANLAVLVLDLVHVPGRGLVSHLAQRPNRAGVQQRRLPVPLADLQHGPVLLDLDLDGRGHRSPADSTPSTATLRVPFGTRTTTTSPATWPSSARASGDASLIQRRPGSLNSSLTILNVSSPASSLTWTWLPTLMVGRVATSSTPNGMSAPDEWA